MTNDVKCIFNIFANFTQTNITWLNYQIDRHPSVTKFPNENKLGVKFLIQFSDLHYRTSFTYRIKFHLSKGLKFANWKIKFKLIICEWSERSANASRFQFHFRVWSMMVLEHVEHAEFVCKSEVNFVIGRRRWKRMVEDPKGRINFFLTQTNLFYNSKHSQQVNMRMMSHVSTTNDDDWLQSRKFMNEWKNLFMLRLILNWLCKYLIKLTTISFLTRWRLIVNKLRIRVLVSLKVNEKEDGKLNDIREKTTTTNVIT